MGTFVEIPIEYKEAHFKIRTVLDDKTLVLQFDWNDEDSRWQISVMDASETPIIMGRPLNINEELFDRFSLDALPPGRFGLVDLSEKEEEAGFDDLGDRCRLYYEIPS